MPKPMRYVVLERWNYGVEHRLAVHPNGTLVVQFNLYRWPPWNQWCDCIVESHLPCFNENKELPDA